MRSGGWSPRDTTVPGAVIRFLDSTYPATVVNSAGLGLSFSDTTRPGYLLNDIAPGTTGTYGEKYQIERPTNNGAYAFSTYQYVTGKTCLPVPTIATIAEVSTTTLSGTGTNVGDSITVTDDHNNVLGTAVVGADLNWTLTLATPLDVAVRKVTATETDEFGFTGDASTVRPLPSVSVGNFVWFDRNGNGLQDAGEPGIEGVSLSLSTTSGAATDVDGDPVPAAVSDASGSYTFTALPPLSAGTHYVVTLDPASVPAGYAPTKTGGDSHTASAESGNLTTSGDSDQTLDFGFYQPIDLSITMTTTSGSQVSPGGAVEFTLTPKNLGPGDAIAGWKVAVTLPAGLSATALSGSGYTCDVAAAVCVADNPLAAGSDGAPIVLKAHVSANAVGSLSTTATITAAASDVDESSLANNTATAAITVVKDHTSPPTDPTSSPTDHTTPPTSPSVLPTSGGGDGGTLANTGVSFALPLIGVALASLMSGIALIQVRRRRKA